MKRYILLLVSCVLSLGLYASPRTAMLYSVLPGGGQIYNAEYVKAGIVIALHGYLGGKAIYNDTKVQDFKEKLSSTEDAFLSQYYKQQISEYRAKRNSDIWWIGITMSLSMMDAYVDAHLKDFDDKKKDLHLKLEGQKLLLEFRY